MREIEQIILHNSASNYGNRAIINKWHLQKGWSGIGYNLVFLNGRTRSSNHYDSKLDGVIEQGRGLDMDKLVDPDEKGAHALGYNYKTLGFCLIGEKEFTVRQFQGALATCRTFQYISKKITIIGHYETSVEQSKSPSKRKKCPNFDMDLFRGVLDSGDYTEKNIRLMMSGFIREN